MFRRHARPQPELAPPSSWQGLVHLLASEGGATPEECPTLCRRKGPHQHMRHEAASADLIVSPSAEERAGA